MGPLLGAVLWTHRRNPSVWVAYAVSGLALGLLQLLVVRVSGGWATYSFMLEKTHAINRPFSVIRAGFTRLALLNLGRSVLWFGLSTLVLWFARLGVRSLQPRNSWQRVLLVYGLLAMAGPLAVCTLYLCEHPGYLAPALAGCYLYVAVAWDGAGGRLGFAKGPIAAIAASLLLFFGLQIPSSRFPWPGRRQQRVAPVLGGWSAARMPLDHFRLAEGSRGRLTASWTPPCSGASRVPCAN